MSAEVIHSQQASETIAGITTFQLSENDLVLNTSFYTDYDCWGQPDGGWDESDKEENYSYLALLEAYSGIPLEGASCLDVGCGTGDLSQFLKKRGVKEYVGVDVYSPALWKARVKYPSEDFQEVDILRESVNGHKAFDFVFCSGALSLQLDSDNYSYTAAMIRRMSELSRVGVAFNFYEEQERGIGWSRLFGYSLPEMVRMCKVAAPSRAVSYQRQSVVNGICMYSYGL